MSKHEIARTDWARGQHKADRLGREQARKASGDRKATGPTVRAPSLGAGIIPSKGRSA